MHLQREVKTMRLCRHPNVLSMHTSFVVDTELWIVMPFMAKGAWG
jgi:serine/threonine-protein kinase OSR1/STK39